LIPFGNLLFLIVGCIESQPGTNEWGPNPWAYNEDTDEISQHLIEDNYKS